jgi:RHS repeat-associated protein
VRGTVNASGALAGSATYDAWGNPLASGGLTATTPFGYAGYYTDATGLDYLINRYYDPSTGQFISVDPDVSQTLAPYAYADGDPVVNRDPTGLTTESYHCVLSGGWRVNVCITTLATWFGGKWDAVVSFQPKSGQIQEIAASTIGMDVCGEGKTPTHDCDNDADEVRNPSAARGTTCNRFGCTTSVPSSLTSGSYYSGIPSGYNWIYAWVNGAWAKSTSGQKSKPVSLHDLWVRTCQSNCVA